MTVNLTTMEPVSAPCYAARLAAFGALPAVVSEAGETVTYVELAGRADAFARQLGSQRRLLAIEARNALEPLIALIAGLRHGHPVMLLPGNSAQNDRILNAFSPD